MTDSTDNHETSVGSDRTEAQAVPFEASCRAKVLSDNAEFATCLVQESQCCPYAWHCGWNWICTHPRRREIVARTQEEHRPSKSNMDPSRAETNPVRPGETAVCSAKPETEW